MFICCVTSVNLRFSYLNCSAYFLCELHNLRKSRKESPGNEVEVVFYGHVLRREDEYAGKRVMVMEVPGKRRRGRPKRRWLDNIRNDSSEREL